MTTAHRPTFDPARGKEALRGPAYHQRLLPAHTQLKFRQAGQGGVADEEPGRDLAAELLAAEAAHFAKTANGTPQAGDQTGKRRLSPAGTAADGEAKRLCVLQSTRALDADDDSGPEASSNDVSDSDDDDAELQRELERVRKERAEKKQREEAARAKEQQEARERDIALGNPLLNKPDFSIKRRWDDDVVFRNQARGTEDRGKKEFVNDLLRSDFHRRFMSKYIR